MRKTLSEIAKIVGGEVVGDGDVVITGFSGLKEAGQGDLTFLDSTKYLSLAEETRASGIISLSGLDFVGKPSIVVSNPSLAFSEIVSIFLEENSPRFEGIHNSAVIAKNARIGNKVAIGPNVVVGNNVHIGDYTKIYGGSYIGNDVCIGQSSIINPNVTILDRVEVGSSVIIHSGTVVGSDGFGFIKTEGRHKKIPQIGTVVIEDYVEIGSNVSIDRARFDKTIIGEGTKIDNLVQIAHNVILGKNCIIISQVGISGSVNIEDDVILAGQVGVVGHLTIGKGAVVASRGVVTKSIPPFLKVSGNPAKDDRKAKKILASVQRLPLYSKTIQELQRKIESLEKRMEDIK